MRGRFVGQPFNSNQIGQQLTGALGRTGMTSFVAVVAWAKASGLSRISSEVKGFRTGGGTAELIVGIDEGGASIEGLQLALELFDVVRVFHDPGPRTFHPKFYVVRGGHDAVAIVGSGNLTLGGLFKNYEAALILDLSVDSAGDDLDLLKDLDDYVDEFRARKANCLVLDETLLAQLIDDPRYRIQSELGRRSGSTGSGAGSGGPSSVFGDPIQGLGGAPTRDPDVEIESDDVDSDVWREPTPPVKKAPAKKAAAKKVADPSLRFYKALRKFDVSTTSAPGQMIIPIQFQPFFEPFVPQHGGKATGKTSQYEHVFSATFMDGTVQVDLPDTRAILYVPASTHPRQNTDLRYTFRSRDVLGLLSVDDILEFSRGDGGRVIIRRRPAGYHPGRYGWL